VASVSAPVPRCSGVVIAAVSGRGPSTAGQAAGARGRRTCAASAALREGSDAGRPNAEFAPGMCARQDHDLTQISRRTLKCKERPVSIWKRALVRADANRDAVAPMGF